MSILKKYKIYFSGLFAILYLSTPVIALAYVQPFAGTTSAGLIDSIIGVINAFLLIGAIFAVVFVIISGVRYFSSQGDENATKQARNTLVYSIIGILIISLSVLIINFILA